MLLAPIRFNYMPSPTEVKEFNKKLRHEFGLLYDQPRFRLVWSEDLLETRQGAVETFYGHIFVKRETGFHQLKKYSYLKDRWILEQSNLSLNPELTQVVGYEPVFVFQDNQGNYLEPVWRAIYLLVDSIMNPRKLSPSDLAEEERTQQEKEIAFFEQYLSGETSYVASMLANKEAVVVPSNYGVN